MVRMGTTRVEVRTVAPPRDAARGTRSRRSRARAVAVAGVRACRASASTCRSARSRNTRMPSGWSPGLRASGFANPIVFSEPNDRRRLHRVRLGPIRDSFEFDQLNTRLRAIGVSGSQLVVDRGP